MVQGVRGIGFWNLDARACGEAEAVDGGCVWLVSEVSIQGIRFRVFAPRNINGLRSEGN